MANASPSHNEKTSEQPPRSFFRRILKVSAWFFGLILLLVAIVGIWAWLKLTRSLPHLDGERNLAGLSQTVSVTRDALGVPTITAASQIDLVRAMGFVHAQDRFIQMDGLRRLPAGELSAVFGASLLKTDQRMRRHQLRHVARASYQTAPARHRRILEAYADGVNQGLEHLKAPPVEYLLLQTKPQPWLPEDSSLVIMAMALDLQDESGNYEKALGTMQVALPAALFQFLTPWGSEWDAPLEGGPIFPGDIPDAKVMNLRTKPKSAARAFPQTNPDHQPGSNNWGVSGRLTPYQSGMIANDMHLNLRVPHIWYRARMIWTDEANTSWDLVGVTLPGAPAMVAGSNRHIAWGFTNSYLDWSDVITLESPPGQPNHYQTPEGPKPIEIVQTTIEVKGDDPVLHEFEQTHWGPVLGRDSSDRRYVVKWATHYSEATNFNLLDLLQVQSVEAAFRVASRCGIPGQNMVVADKDGHLGWTIAGMIPNRIGFDGRTPTTWSDGSRKWDGWLPPDQYPKVYDPTTNRIWTANARVVGTSHLYRLGESHYALGARAKQIRDRLMDKDLFQEKDMLAIQLDDEALFLARWRALLLSRIEKSNEPMEKKLRNLVENWGGHARVDSAGYRLVRHFRININQTLLGALTAEATKIDPDFDCFQVPQYEGVIWKILQERPPHLLPSQYIHWDDFLDSQIDQLIEEATSTSDRLENHTWGRRNTLEMRHLLSKSIPMFSDRLDMPAQALNGDGNMPFVQGRKFGASQRMVVAPGHEDQALFHMPGGQSAHPLSPFYQAGHDDWVEGRATPLLPGLTQHKLLLHPQK